MKKYFWFFLLVACAPQLNLKEDHVSANTSAAASKTTITIINVHQGDATLVTTAQNHHLLIDAGTYYDHSKSLLHYLDEHQIKELDAIFVTHFDLDHYGGLLLLNEGLDETPNTGDEIAIHQIFDRGTEVTDQNYFYQQYDSLYQSLSQTVEPGNTYTFDEITLKILMVNGHTQNISFETDPDSENAQSAVYFIETRQTTFLNMGDLPSSSKESLADPSDFDTEIASITGPIDFLHVGHHGSAYSTSEALLKITQPKASFISVGNNNPYGHPTESVLNRLENSGTKIYLTESGNGGSIPDDAIVVDGDIEITIDDNRWVVE